MPAPSDPLTWPPVRCLPESGVDSAVDDLDGHGWLVLRLGGEATVDKASLLRQFEADLPMPEGLHPHNWDALADCLWAMVAGTGGQPVGLVWDRADVLAGSDMQSFVTAVVILHRLASESSPALRVVLAGAVPAFAGSGL